MIKSVKIRNKEGKTKIKSEENKLSFNIIA